MRTADPFSESEPVWIILGFKLPSPGMKAISSGFDGERMDQQQAGVGITGCDEPGNRLKVPARLLSRPSCGVGGEFLKMENATRLRVATVAASVSRPLFYKYRLHPGFKKIEVQSAF
jgi:hypothetical protein